MTKTVIEPELTEMTNSPLLGMHSQPVAFEQQRINANTARNIHRHSRFIRVLRWILPLFCVGIVGIFLYSSGILQNFFSPAPEKIKPVISEKSVEMVQPRMSGLDKKNRTYQIAAKSARQSIEDPTKVTLEDISGSLALNETDGKVTLTAKSGFLDTESNFLQLKKDIIITSKQGYTAYLISANAKLKEKYITSNDPVLIEWDGGSIRANGLEITDQGNVIKFLKHVKVTLKPEPGNKEVN